MTNLDGRVCAWTTAWQLLEAAQKARMGDGIINPADYDNALREAEMFIQLAHVDGVVGYVAGAWLEQQWEARIQAESARTASAFDYLMNQREEGGEE